MNKDRMVVGFLFSPDKKDVVLIKKNKPDWQKGLLNGVGGHRKGAETINYAMMREFREETGVTIVNWERFAKGVNNHKEIEVYFYRAFNREYDDVKSTTDETVYIVPVEELKHFSLLYNLHWLILLALDEQTLFTEFNFELK